MFLTDADRRYATQFAKLHATMERKVQSIFYKALAESVVPVFETLNINNVRSDVWLPAYQKAYRIVGQRFALNEFKYLKAQDQKDLISFLNDLFAQRMAAYGAAVAFKFSQDLTDTTIERIQAALAYASEHFYTRSQTARLIKEYTLGTIGKARSLLIARTETTTAANIAKVEGVKEYFRELGQDVNTGYKVWITRIDGRERHDHEIANEQAVLFNEKFEVGAEQANVPGDPTLSGKERIRCRCTFISMTAEGYRRRLAMSG
jgi:hypothetical protein